MNNTLTYEIFYGTGGYSGPFTSDTAAVDHAVAMGERTMVLALRSEKGIGGYLPLQLCTVALTPQSQIGRTHVECRGWELLLSHQIPMAFKWMGGVR